MRERECEKKRGEGGLGDFLPQCDQKRLRREGGSDRLRCGVIEIAAAVVGRGTRRFETLLLQRLGTDLLLLPRWRVRVLEKRAPFPWRTK